MSTVGNLGTICIIVRVSTYYMTDCTFTLLTILTSSTTALLRADGRGLNHQALVWRPRKSESGPLGIDRTKKNPQSEVVDLKWKWVRSIGQPRWLVGSRFRHRCLPTRWPLPPHLLLRLLNIRISRQNSSISLIDTKYNLCTWAPILWLSLICTPLALSWREICSGGE